jgi:hypothetical protein
MISAWTFCERFLTKRQQGELKHLVIHRISLTWGCACQTVHPSRLDLPELAEGSSVRLGLESLAKGLADKAELLCCWSSRSRVNSKTGLLREMLSQKS